MTNMVKRRVSLVKRETQAPAMDLDHAPRELNRRHGKAQFALSQVGVADVEAEVVLVLDRSGSMRADYQNGMVQMLVERALGISLQIDSDGTVPIIPFDTVVLPTVHVTMENWSGVVDREIGTKDMGRTFLAPALEEVRKIAESVAKPIFLIVICDGNPDDRDAATDLVCELASYPIFIKFLAIRPVSYLEVLDDMEEHHPGARLLDNVDTQFIPDVATLSDLKFYKKLVEEWPEWLTAAQAAGLIR